MRFWLVILIGAAMVTAAVTATAGVQWEIGQTLKMDHPPKDMAVSAGGKYLFVLSEDGSLYIYNADGSLNDTIPVGDNVDAIGAGAEENKVYLQSKADRSVRLLDIEFIQQIDVTGAPFKGPADARVMIAVFSDFQ